jgi:hypothetical protein
MVIGFVAEADSTSTVTVDLNGNGALALQVGGAACAGGEVNNGQFHQIGFDGTQWQLINPMVAGNFQPLSAKLTAIAALAVTDGNIIVGDGSTFVAESGATARASLGLTIGTNVQAYDALLASIAGLTFGSNNYIYGTGSDTAAVGTVTSFARTVLDDADAATARTTLGVPQSTTELLNAKLAMTNQAVSTGSSTLSIDMSSGWHVSLSLGHTITTFNATNAPANGILGKLTIDISSTGAFAISDWPGTVIWAGGTPPTITSGNGKKDTIILTTTDGGSNWRGYIASQDMS